MANLLDNVAVAVAPEVLEFVVFAAAAAGLIWYLSIALSDAGNDAATYLDSINPFSTNGPVYQTTMKWQNEIESYFGFDNTPLPVGSAGGAPLTTATGQ